MSFNGSGVFVRLYNWVNDAAANIKIRADRMDAEFNGIATGLTNCITKDGQTTVTANLPMSGFKHTGVGNASASNEYAAYGQLTTALAAITFDSLSDVVLTSPASNDFIYYNGTNWVNRPVSSYALTLLDDADATAARATLGLGTSATTSSSSYATASQGKATTRQYLTSGTAATYTTPSGCTKLFVRMVGGGGGGAAFVTNAGSDGGATSFGSFTANGGRGGTLTGIGANGGSGGSGSALLRLAGGRGAPSDTSSAHGGFGGGTFLIGPTTGGAQNSAGLDAQINTGAGGQGAASAGSSKGGGGAGEYVEFEILTPSATYTYTIGSGGAGGAAGTNAGGNGGSGIIIVEEFYGS